jgi:hypothetical protein
MTQKKINYMPNMPIHTKHVKTCSIKLMIFITIVMKRNFTKHIIAYIILAYFPM